MTARILAVTQAEYREDPCSLPSLTQSTAHTLISQSPLHAWTFHPKLGGMQRPRTDAKDNGTLIHKLVLGKGIDLAVLGVADYRTNAAKAARDEAIAAGLLPVKEKDYEEAEHAATLLTKRLNNEFGIVLDGQSEVAFQWEEMGQNGPVICRGMMDHVKVSDGVIYDVKSIRSAHPDVCARHMSEYGYDSQWACYVSALEKFNSELVGRVDFKFIFMETNPPYCIVPAEPDGLMQELGWAKWNRAIKLWERCLTTDTWPGYATGVVRLTPKPWHLTAMIEDEEEDGAD